MCDICKNIEKGEHQGLGYTYLDAKFGDVTVKDHIELSTYIGRDDEGNYVLSSRQYIGDEIAAEVKVPINRCPFCGARLQHKADAKYPWND